MIEYFLMAFFAAGSGSSSAQGQGQGRAATAPVPRVAAPPEAPTPAPDPVAPADFKNPVQISADRFEIQGKRQQAVWLGKVKAIRGRTVLTCDRLVAHYTRAQEITRIVCTGNVEATHGDMWAKGERADFDNVAGLLVVTGNPQARKGRNRMAGTKIIFDVGRDTINVENAETLFDSEATKITPPGRKGR